jgi:hypothetical protein
MRHYPQKKVKIMQKEPLPYAKIIKWGGED